MIDIDDKDIAARLKTEDGRFILLTSTDLPKNHPLPWWGVTFDTGGDGHGILVRLDQNSGPEGWTGLDLLSVAAARASAELDRRPGPISSETLDYLRRAIAAERNRTRPFRIGVAPVLRAGGMPSPYPWTEAVQGENVLPLCPDPESRQEGVTPEQILLVLVLLYGSMVNVRPRERAFPVLRDHVASALRAEHRRLLIIRD